jgi:hypothetical protein
MRYRQDNEERNTLLGQYKSLRKAHEKIEELVKQGTYTERDFFTMETS